MLWLLQAAPPQIPPIHVTVLQPPAPAGLPEWVKILITAGVGALFGITTNTAMEFIKPAVAKRNMRREILRYLFFGNLKQNLDNVAALYRLSERAENGSEDDRKACLSFVWNGTPDVSGELHRSYYERQRELVDELDPARRLFGFYERVRRAEHMARQFDFATAKANLGLALTVGKEILDAHGVTYVAPPSEFYDKLIQPKVQ